MSARLMGGVIAFGIAVCMAALAGLPAMAQQNPVIQPGMRIVFLGSAASIPGESTVLVPSPNGGWVNQRTGQTYNLEDNPGGGGAGYVALDIIEVTPQHIIGFSNNWLLYDLQTGATTHIEGHGFIDSGENIADFWVEPRKLAAIGDVQSQTQIIRRMPYPLGGQTYSAIRMQLYSNGGWTQNTYDTVTGLLLVATSNIAGKGTQVLGPDNTIQPGAGTTSITYSQIMNVRKTNLPGPGMRLPANFLNLRKLVYAGQYGFNLRGAEMQTPGLPMQIEVTITGSAPTHISAMLTERSAAALGISVPIQLIAGGIGGFYLDPTYLASLRQGVVLDEDQVLKTRTFVASVDNTMVMLTVQSPFTAVTYGYDRQSGMLVYNDSRTDTGLGPQYRTVQLQSVQ
ncbi:MAG: hypothetical protein HXY22_09465 [Alphaproteobacteria bacterium]|nr:hypothetical protein [Alphaproteobacteria bacterium]